MNASKQKQARMTYLVQNIRRQMVICGMISSTTNLYLDWGSKTNGNCFDLWVGSPGNPHEYKPFTTVFFGMTYRDAEARMTALLAGMLEVNNAWEKKVTATLGKTPIYNGPTH